MKRIKDDFLTTISSVVVLHDAHILEIGCGTGARSVQIAAACKQLTAIEPNATLLEEARRSSATPNISYQHGTASNLPFPDSAFDIVLFTLSFPHVPIDSMPVAIDEAVRVVQSHGHVIFLEPAFEGSFFESEIAFDACDGDERKEKACAYENMLKHPQIQQIAELPDETIFSFDSVQDFVDSLLPKKGSIEEIEQFLHAHDFVLNAKRRINIFRPK